MNKRISSFHNAVIVGFYEYLFCKELFVEMPYKDAYSGSGSLTGTFKGSETAHGTVVHNKSQVWENGILTSEITTSKPVEADYGRIDTAALEGGAKKLLDE